MKRKLLSVLLALVLALSLCLVTAVPASAQDPGVSPQTAGDGIAEWSAAKANTGSYSTKLSVPDGLSDMAGICIDTNIPVGELNELTFWKYVESFGTKGWNPEVRLFIDADNDGLEFTTEDFMTFDLTPAGPGGVDRPHELLGDDGIVWCSDAAGSLAGVDTDWVKRDFFTDMAWWYYAYVDEANYMEPIADLSSLTGTVVRVVIFIGGSHSWNEETAYVDDVTINGVPYPLEWTPVSPIQVDDDRVQFTDAPFQSIQGAIDCAIADETISVAAGTYDEQVEIAQSLTLQGAGDTTIIQPSGPALEPTTSIPWIGGGTGSMAAIVSVETTGEEVTIQNLEIDGSLITSKSTTWMAGLVYLETGGLVEGVTVNGGSILPDRTAGIFAAAITETVSLEVTECTVEVYTRAGIYALGAEFTANYHHNEINGPAGAILTGVPNGMFFLEGTNGSATYNTVTDLGYAGGTYRSTGIGTYNAGTDVTFAHNNISNVQNAFALSTGTIGTIVEYNETYNCHTGVRIEAGAASSVIQYNEIHDNDFAMRCGPEMGDGNEAHYNNFVDNPGLEWVNEGEGCTYEGAVCNLHATYILDATNNWWGDISGPTFEGTGQYYSGAGDKVSDNVEYVPWLTRDFQTALDDNIGYFGIPMVYLDTGWNTFSTPIALDPACDTWGNYKALGDGLEVIKGVVSAYRYDAGASPPHFVAVASEYQLKPCDAIYVRMAESDIAAILFSPETSAPTKEVYPGWNLIGLASLDSMPVDDALTSLYRVSGDLTGYSQVISPPFYQEPWTFVRDGSPQIMQPTYGYWVFMENGPDTLAGFTFTPMSLTGGAPPPPPVKLAEVDFQWYPVTGSRSSADDADDWDYGDDASFTYTLPSWTFPFAGRDIVEIEVSSNGHIELLESGEGYEAGSDYGTTTSFRVEYPGCDFIFAWLDDLSSEYHGFYGVEYDSDNDVVVVHWETETYSDDNDDLLNYFQVWLSPDGSIQWNFLEFNYEDFSKALETGIYDSDSGTLLDAAEAMGEPDGIFNTPLKSYRIFGEYLP